MQLFPDEADGTPVHATCLDYGGRGLLIAGPSGSGKSDLALRLLDRPGWRLVVDDRVQLSSTDRAVLATAPVRLRGLLEIRGQGIVRLRSDELAATTRIIAAVQLVERPNEIERLPDPAAATVLCRELPLLLLWPFELSAPLKLERWMAAISGTSRQQMPVGLEVVSGGAGS